MADAPPLGFRLAAEANRAAKEGNTELAALLQEAGREFLSLRLLWEAVNEVNAPLREALKPFAKVADDYDDREDDTLRLMVDADHIHLTVGDVRKARAALTN